MSIRRRLFVLKRTISRAARVFRNRLAPSCALRQNPLRLELGSGRSPSEGFLHCDGYLAPHIDFVFDMERKWIFPTECADVIRAYHLIEHFSHTSVRQIVARWVASLKPGGTLELKTPNFRWIVDRYLAGDLPNFYESHPWMREFDLFGILFGGQENKYNFHKNAFGRERPEALLLECGCASVELLAEDNELHMIGRKQAL